MVFVFHYGGGLQSSHRALRILGYLTQTGWIGVVLFFALSGFLITGGLWDSLQDSPSRKPAVLRNFYIRRALRILPLYFATLLAAAVATIACGALLSELRPLVFFAFFLQNLPVLAQAVIQNSSPLPLYHLWSLAVEEQFYLLWPALLLLARTRRSTIHLCLWIFAIAALFRIIVFGLPALAWTHQQHLFDSFLLTQCGALVLGAALALALRPDQPLSDRPDIQALQRWASLAFLAGIALYLLSSFLCGSFYLYFPLQYMLGLPAVSIVAAALILILLRPGIPRTIASFSPLVWLGRISYGFYVFHILLQPLYDTLGEHLAHAATGTLYQTARFAVAFPITVLAAWISYHLLELPFLETKWRFPLRPSLPRDLEP